MSPATPKRFNWWTSCENAKKARIASTIPRREMMRLAEIRVQSADLGTRDTRSALRDCALMAGAFTVWAPRIEVKSLLKLNAVVLVISSMDVFIALISK